MVKLGKSYFKVYCEVRWWVEINKKKLVVSSSLIIIALICLGYFLDLYNHMQYANDDSDYLISIRNIEEFYTIKSGVIYIGADYCPTCVELKPIIEEYSSKNKNIIYYLDIEYFVENKLLSHKEITALLSKYNVKEIPTLIKIDNYIFDSLVTFGYVSSDDTGSLMKHIDDFVTYDENNISLISKDFYEVVIVIFLVGSIAIAFMIYIFILKGKVYKFKFIIIILNLLIIIAMYAIRRQLI